MSKKLTKEIFIEKAKKVHGDMFDYSLVEYTNNITKIQIQCKKNHIFEQRPADHLQGVGCPKCVGKNKTTGDFINESIKIHGDMFDYSLVNYKSSDQKVILICQYKHIFKQTPNNHLSKKQGCPICAGVNKSNTMEFINKAKNIHGDKYDYSLVNYKNANTKVKIICPEHREFEQKPNHHLNCRGCPKCAGKYRTTEEFIQDAITIHGNKYDYSLVEYKNCDTKVKIICQDHGEFEQLVYSHLYGQGCPICKTSKPETAWLDSLNIPQENRQMKILKYVVDGYDPDTNTIYEFNGDFWHGNPSIYEAISLNPRCNRTFGELYEKTKQKEQALKNSGYNVISIWESDWNKQIDKV